MSDDFPSRVRAEAFRRFEAEGFEAQDGMCLPLFCVGWVLAKIETTRQLRATKAIAMANWNDFNASDSFFLDGALKDTTIQTFNLYFTSNKGVWERAQELINQLARNGARVYKINDGRTGVQVDARPQEFETILATLAPYKEIIKAIGFFDPVEAKTAKGVLTYWIDPLGEQSGFFP